MNEPSYPQRPPFFALRVIRLMVKSCVMNTHGAQVFGLIAAVAATEDSAKYKRAVTFYDSQLMPIVGANSRDTLARVREKAVKSGWLHYEPGRRATPGRYWTTIPDDAEAFTDAPVDENPDEYGAVAAATVRQEPRSNPAESAIETAAQSVRMCRTSLPSPVPNPKEEGATRNGSLDAVENDKTKSTKSTKAKNVKLPKADGSAVPVPAELDTPAFREVWAEWHAHRRGLRKPITAIAANRQFKKLAPLGPTAAAECVAKSITSGWSDVFPEKFNSGSGTHRPGYVLPGQPQRHEIAPATMPYCVPDGDVAPTPPLARGEKF
ncbi:hypothetical protein [Limnoglobus roseus]|uniref:Uncharacterized protein n=1 Tax=Limnoglobus roseus TaxID=2598579 RepID=A0A5C1A672_9BACT|nr:hypothetical protein [Limnoglobus roseus]QEL14651.1 hypothetical protein PX52LOC_01544 [Limnoglobus roseus]